MHRKTPILGPRSSVTPDAVDLKFGTRDYVVGATQHAKKLQQSAQQGPPGNGVKYHVQMFFYFFVISCAALENTFLGVSPPFLRQTTCSGGD